MRKKIIAVNWKMHKTVSETESFLKSFILEIGDLSEAEIVIAPPFTALAKASEILADSYNIKLAAQNMHPEKSGAFTGEISPAMLRDLYIHYVILGHSERRTLFGETNDFINRKVHVALENQLRPILCIGETLEERDTNRIEEVLSKQLQGGLNGVSKERFTDIVIAYEPVWAIGTGRAATPEQAQDAHAYIRKVLATLSDDTTADKMRIQYGGSVKPENTEVLMSQSDIDGSLVGNAGLEVRSFCEIIFKTIGKQP